jgi:hypothetical protein
VSPDLSISIVTGDNGAQALDCLRSLFAHAGGLSLEVFVLDNASGDGSAERIAASFPRVNLIRSSTRAGFATNHNTVMARCAGRYMMLLNDDTIIQPGALAALVGFMDQHAAAGAAGAALLNPAGTPQRSFDIFPTPLYEALRPLSSCWRRYPATPQQPLAVDSVSGACMLVRRAVLSQVGLLDPDFDPLYSEEVEWCYRLKRAGWQVYHVPAARVVHLGSQTMNRLPLNRIDRLYEKKLLFFRKHGTPSSARQFKYLLWAASLGKLSVWSLLFPLKRRAAAAQIRTHWHVARTVWSWD